ncbi:unnamed protein product [Laminaria digitata]
MLRSRSLAVALAGLLAQGACGLYADEAGKLDWHRQNLGRFVSASFDGRGGLTVVGEASTLASVDLQTGDLAWRQVLSPEDTILATSVPNAGTPSTVTVSDGGKVVRLWSPDDGSLVWDTSLGVGAASGVGAAGGSEGPGALGGGDEALMSAGVVSTDGGEVVVLAAGGIHVLSAATGAVLAQWWCVPAREPDLAALVGAEAQVTFTSLRLVPGGGGSLMAGGWSSGKGSDKAEAFVIAEINPSERLVTFKAAQVRKFGVDPSAGVTVAHIHGGGSGKEGLAVVGLCGGGKSSGGKGDSSSLAVFSLTSDPASAVEAVLPPGVRGSAAAVSGLADLAGTGGGVLQLRQEGGGAVAVALSSGAAGAAVAGGVSVVENASGAKEAWSCPVGGGGDCVLAGGRSPSGKTYVASASMRQGGVAGGDNVSGKVKVVVSVAEVTAWGDFTASPVSSFQTEALSSLGRDSSGVVEAAFLEAAEGASCAAGAAGDSRVCFRALVVKEDDSAVMVGEGGLEWVREEALAAVDQVVFVDSSKDELAVLAASGQVVEHHVPGWQERIRLHRLELTTYVGKVVNALTGISLPGSELLKEVDASHSAFGLKKLAICTTKAGKLYALDMADGSVAWNLFHPTWFPENAEVLLYATRSKGALGYSPEVAVIAVGEQSTVVSRRDALTGMETSRESIVGKVASVLPMGVKDSQERSVLMVVDSDQRVSTVPNSADASGVLHGLLPHLFYHNLSEAGLESFAVVPAPASDEGAPMGSAPVASLPFHPTRSKLVATAYPDRRDGVPTPAHTLGDDSLLIKYINPRLLAFATLSPDNSESVKTVDGGAGSSDGKGQELMVTLVDYVSGRILHRISHKGAAEPVHMQVSESWVVYSYWSAANRRTEVSTLSLYEGMIDKYGLSPFNRPEWKEDFSSFESRVPIVLQKTFIFPLPVTGLGITLTEHGITSKNILVATALGQVVSLDRRFLDPRRPQEEPSKAEKEEKLLQYQPFLPVVPTQVLSYYKVIERVNRVLTEPTGLESTSLVLALGLDLFGCRVAPSKTYDMLDPNFNYALLVLVLGAMTTAVLIASRLAANKRLKEQWA